MFSLLDRLTDLEPDVSREGAMNEREEARIFKASLCRDLAALLNTRRAKEDFDPEFVECTRSLLAFGVADFTSYNLKSSPEQERVRRSIERAIRDFEPRLTRVTVVMTDPDPRKPVLSYQVSAQLRTDPGAEDVLFDATLRRDSRRFSVAGGNA